MKHQKYFIFILLFIFTSISFQDVKATEIFGTQAQLIEIAQQEVLLLQALIKNYTLGQEITADAYMVVDLSDSSVLLEKNPNKPYSIASVTKLMNAVISLQNIDMQKTITVTDEMTKPLGDSPCIYSGLTITAENLLKAALIQSSNDAAEALSYFIGNEKFIKLMNQQAENIGMKNTAYYDVYGINSNNQSTASDLIKLVAYINKNYPEIWEIGKVNNFWLPDSSGFMLKFKNVNNFYPLSNFIGGKTGYTIEAKQAIASAWEINGKEIAIIVLSSENRMADVFNITRQLKEKVWQ